MTWDSTSNVCHLETVLKCEHKLVYNIIVIVRKIFDLYNDP